jgi:RHS repeat-associated protein
LGHLSTERTHNIFGETIRETARYETDMLYHTEYNRDKLGRITQRVETIEGITTTIDYRYDMAERLIEVKQNGMVTEAYAYDGNGNRLTAQTENGITNGSYDNQDRLIQYGNNTYDYTANGELLSKDNNGKITQYQYDVLGNLRSVHLPEGQQIEYLIDARNRRIGKKVNGILTQGFLYQDSFNPIAELDGEGNVVARFVYGSKANIPDYMVKNGSAYHILSDHLGSPRLVVDINTGYVAQRMDYDAFGDIIFDSTPGFQPFGFAGGIYDLDTKLTRFGARDYDAQIGRWTAKDPILFDGGDTNLYGYVLNDPMNLNDPKGLSPSFGDCLVECLANHWLGALIAGTMVVAGQPTQNKPFVTKPVEGRPGSRGASEKSSVATKWLYKSKIAKKLGLRTTLPKGIRVWTPTTAVPHSTSNKIGHIIARWVPWVGWGILAYESIGIALCVYSCMEDEEGVCH